MLWQSSGDFCNAFSISLERSSIQIIGTSNTLHPSLWMLSLCANNQINHTYSIEHNTCLFYVFATCFSLYLGQYQEYQYKNLHSFIHSFISIQPQRPGWQEPEPSRVTGMALAHCILPLLSPAFRRSHFRCQVPVRPQRGERSQQRKVELWARNLSGNFG